MSQPCAIPSCKSKSTSVCNCCNKNLCIDHVKEHNEITKLELNHLNNEIINLNNNFKGVNMNKIIGDSRQILDLWKTNTIQMINDYYEQKCLEIEQFSIQKFDQHHKEIDQIQTIILDFIQNEKATQKNVDLLKLKILNIKKEIKKFKEKGIEIDIKPLIFDNNSISIKDSKPNAFNIDPENLLNPQRTIESVDGWQAELVSNERFILINLAENLCLFNRDLILIKQSPWISEAIYDMCWSSTLANFIIITEKKKVYKINETTLVYDRVFGIEDKDWLSCTCSETYLYLTTRDMGTSIYQFKLLPLIRPVKQWLPPHSCKQYQSIHHMQYNDQKIACIIRESFGGVVDIELRSAATFNRIWSLPLDIRSPGLWSRISCRSLPYDEWLIVHSNSSRLFHIDKDGKLKIVHQYHSKLKNAITFGSNTLVVHLGTKVNFHKI